jgi:hypothetical protein
MPIGAAVLDDSNVWSSVDEMTGTPPGGGAPTPDGGSRMSARDLNDA